MKKIAPSLLLAAAFASAVSVLGQTNPSPAVTAPGSVAPAPAPRPRVSPHETVGAVIDGNRVTVVYGRPYRKDPKTGDIRTVWGGQLVPAGKVWRTGADEATLLLTERAIELGDATIPAGAHTLWTHMNDDGTAQLIVNKQVGQWGANRDFKRVYDEANDVARIALKKEPLSSTVEQFTIAIERGSSGGGTLKLMWADTQFSAPIALKK